MRMAKSALCKILKYSGCAVIACGLSLTVGLQAQSYSSSKVAYNFQNNDQYNSQYNNPYNRNQYNQNQYNQRRTPRYTGEGSISHFVFEGGGGGTPAAGNTQNYANPGWNALAGIGFRFNDRLSLLAEWSFNRMGVPHSLAYEQAQTPDGNEHLWTVDLNPKFNVIKMGSLDGYVIGGGGFSRALTNFTFPVIVPCGYGYGFGYGYGGCVGNITVAHTSSNQANFDIGVGGEWRLSPYERGKIFLEARYVKLFTPNNGLPPGYNAALIPVTVGFRW